MEKSDAIKRIKNAIDTLNTMDNKLVFSYEETDYSVELICKSKTKDTTRFGAYEYIGLFEEYVNKVDAYINCMLFAELIVVASKINDKNAYHNLAF
ncbi:MAG: hypothetical protein UHN47_07090 [Lachnospiraceae bacterium]|nr:hypothetical protein [Lachnospiraceae bacterium]